MKMIGLLTGVHASETSPGWCPIPPGSSNHRDTSVEKTALATRYPMVAGIMTFASAVLCILIGLWVLTASVMVADMDSTIDIRRLELVKNGTIIVSTLRSVTVSMWPHAWLNSNGLLIGMCSFITTGFGLASAYLTYKKEHYRLAILGISLVVVTSVVLSLFVNQGWIVGTPTLVMAALSMAFVTFSKNEFR